VRRNFSGFVLRMLVSESSTYSTYHMNSAHFLASAGTIFVSVYFGEV